MEWDDPTLHGIAPPAVGGAAGAGDMQPSKGFRPAVPAEGRTTFPAFPRDPYPIQVEFMRALTKALSKGGVGLFESPTGRQSRAGWGGERAGAPGGGGGRVIWT